MKLQRACSKMAENPSLLYPHFPAALIFTAYTLTLKALAISRSTSFFRSPLGYFVILYARSLTLQRDPGGGGEEFLECVTYPSASSFIPWLPPYS